jgi:dTDP-glucose 4,6-dehydratase
MSERTTVVTGAAGFIGSNFVRHLLAATTARVVGLDKLTYAGNLESLADVLKDPRFTFVQADIGDGRAMRELLRAHRPAAIVNFAAETHVDRSIDGPRAFVETNLVGTFELLEAVRRHLAEEGRGSACRLLHVSTDEVYGSLGPEGAFSETTPYAPNSPYAASKAGADHLARAYHETYGLDVVITNCSNNYGPYQFPEKLIPLMILNAVEGKPLPIYGDGGNVRDWLYVEDHCEGIRVALERGRAGEKYNIGGGNERSNREVVDRICAILDRERPPSTSRALTALGHSTYAALRTFVKDRPGHDRRYAIDATRIREELGWRPRHDFDAGLLRTVRWYLAHREWCEAVQAGRYSRERLGLGPKER